MVEGGDLMNPKCPYCGSANVTHILPNGENERYVITSIIGNTDGTMSKPTGGVAVKLFICNDCNMILLGANPPHT